MLREIVLVAAIAVESVVLAGVTVCGEFDIEMEAQLIVRRLEGGAVVHEASGPVTVSGRARAIARVVENPGAFESRVDFVRFESVEVTASDSGPLIVGPAEAQVSGFSMAFGDGVGDEGEIFFLEPSDNCVYFNQIEVGWAFGGRLLIDGGTEIDEDLSTYSVSGGVLIGDYCLLGSSGFGSGQSMQLLLAPQLDVPTDDGSYRITLLTSEPFILDAASMTEVTLIPADLAFPFTELDFRDVVEFLTLFSEGDPAADFAPPLGQLDFSDVVAFLESFTAGCDPGPLD